MRYLKYFTMSCLLFLSNIIYTTASDDNKGSSTDVQTTYQSPPPFSADKPYSILLIEEGENSLGVYHSGTRKEIGRIKLNFYPHEIEISQDMKRAYVSNFGIRDYDAKIGYPGNSISVIDLENFCEINRIYTIDEGGQQYWGPHGLKLHPDGLHLYVNVECVNGRFPTSNAPQDSRMLIINLENNKIDKKKPGWFFPPPLSSGPNADSEITSYPLSAGAHNFIFSPHSTNTIKKDYRDIWYYAGPNGVFRINSETGEVIKHYPTNTQQPKSKSDKKFFNGAVRGLAFNEKGTQLLVSAKNEISIIDLAVGSNNYGSIIKQFGNLEVGQLFYSRFITNTDFVLAPAARESQVLVIDTGSQSSSDQSFVKRLVTGVDPLQVILSPIPGEKKAYITNADSPWVSEIEWRPNDNKSPKSILDSFDFEIKNRILTKGGANGIAFSDRLPKDPALVLKLGVCLPFTGQYAAEARECLLGLQFWQEVINGAGGIVVKGERYEVAVCYKDTESAIDEDKLKEIVLSLLREHAPNQKNEGILAVFGTYPPSANLTIAKILNTRDIPLITATGREPSLFNAGLPNVFGISPIRQKPDLIGTFQAIYKHKTPKPRTAMVLACEHDNSQEEAKDLTNYLMKNGIKVLSPYMKEGSEEFPIITFSHCPAYNNTIELDALNQKIARLSKEAQENCQYYPDLLFVSGHRKESATIINACTKYDFTYGSLALDTGITSHHFLTQVTAPTENLLGSVCWSETCSSFGEDRFVASTDFQRMFYDRYSEEPSELVAGFAASGIVIEEALKKSQDHSQGGDFRGKILQAVLKDTDLKTFYGPIKFETDGSNITKPMITVQLRSQGSKIQGVPIWPLSVAGMEKPKYPSNNLNN